MQFLNDSNIENNSPMITQKNSSSDTALRRPIETDGKKVKRESNDDDGTRMGDDYKQLEEIWREYQLPAESEAAQDDSISRSTGATPAAETVVKNDRFPFPMWGEEHWQKNYEKLKASQCEIHGLGDWVKIQRQQYNEYTKGRPTPLTKQRKELLDEIGFECRVGNRPDNEEHWNSKYEQLVAYKERHGNTCVPLIHEGLGRWVSRQRCQYQIQKQGKHSFLTLHRFEKLDSIGFTWSVHKSPKQILEGIESLRTPPSPVHRDQLPTESEAEPDVSNTIVSTATVKATMIGSETKIPPSPVRDQTIPKDDPSSSPKDGMAQLDSDSTAKQRTEISEKRSPREFILNEDRGIDKEWLIKFKRLVAYKEKNGSTNVLRKEDLYLAKWVVQQRTYCASKQRFDMLNDIGFDWDPRSSYWMSMYNKLKAYKLKHGSIKVKPTNVSEEKLLSWMTNQRYACKHKKRIDLLNALGVCVKPTVLKSRRKRVPSPLPLSATSTLHDSVKKPCILSTNRIAKADIDITAGLSPKNIEGVLGLIGEQIKDCNAILDDPLSHWQAKIAARDLVAEYTESTTTLLVKNNTGRDESNVKLHEQASNDVAQHSMEHPSSQKLQFEELVQSAKLLTQMEQSQPLQDCVNIPQRTRDPAAWLPNNYYLTSSAALAEPVQFVAPTTTPAYPMASAWPYPKTW